MEERKKIEKEDTPPNQAYKPVKPHTFKRKQKKALLKKRKSPIGAIKGARERAKRLAHKEKRITKKKLIPIKEPQFGLLCCV